MSTDPNDPLVMLQAQNQKQLDAQLQQYRDWQTAQVREHTRMTSQRAAEVRNQQMRIRQGQENHRLPPEVQVPARTSNEERPAWRSEGWERRAEEQREQLQRTGQMHVPPVSSKPNATFADHALEQERAFRERQARLSDQIERAPSQVERDRLTLVQSAEFHSHHGEQLERVIAMQTICDRANGTTPETTTWIKQQREALDQHRAQGAAALSQLSTMTKTREQSMQQGNAIGPANTTQADHATTAVKPQPDDKASNPAAERLRERQADARSHGDDERSPVAEQSVASLRADRDTLAKAERDRSDQPEERKRASR